jgi:hypothetical protein
MLVESLSVYPADIGWIYKLILHNLETTSVFVESARSRSGKPAGVIYYKNVFLRAPAYFLQYAGAINLLPKMALLKHESMLSSEQIDPAEQVDHIEVDRAKELVGLPNAFTAQEERACLRKIDLWLTPMMVVTYGLQYIDKVILGGASQFGIVQDLHLYTIVGYNAQTNKPVESLHRFSMVTLIFYWGYLAGSMLFQALSHSILDAR